MKKIKITQGKFSIVDDIDFEWLNKFNWHLHSDGYAYSWMGSKKNKKSLMHRLILHSIKGQIVDHINMNRLDNQRSNLRLCTVSQNVFHSKLFSHNRSGFKGVSWFKPVNLGYFKNMIDAIESRKLAEIKYFGVFANK